MAIDKVGGVGATGPAQALGGGKESFGKILSEVGPKQVMGQQTAPEPASKAAQILDRIGEAQKRLDSILELAQRGRSFSAAELLSMQARVYRASQELDLAGKVLEKATSGVKQVLQTQL
jgi:hypothetical protein